MSNPGIPENNSSFPSGPGEFIGYYSGKIGGAIAGYTYGGKVGGIIGEEAGGHIGSKIGNGLDNIVQAQSDAVKRDYDSAISQGLDPGQAIKYALDVNGLND